jgi:hypothetical protein
VWFGRVIMILAVVNGGVGIQYAANSVPGEKGYGVVAGVGGLAYIAVLIWVYVTGGRKAEGRKSEDSVVVGPFGEKEARTEVKEV